MLSNYQLLRPQTGRLVRFVAIPRVETQRRARLQSDLPTSRMAEIEVPANRNFTKNYACMTLPPGVADRLNQWSGLAVQWSTSIGLSGY
jgi:hypothetical protein